MPAEGSIASRYSRRRIGTPRFKEAFSMLPLFIPIFNSISLARHFLFRGSGGNSRTIGGSDFRRLTRRHRSAPARILSSRRPMRRALQKAEIDKWWPIIKAANIRVE
jgi:hypothetical protein